jgi:hypothetical protein
MWEEWTMRELTSHRVNPANDKLTVQAMDPPGPGGACHLYLISGFVATEANNPALNYHPSAGPGTLTGASLLFQNGPIAEVGVNGVTHEALLAVLIDRLEAFQAGPYANGYNQVALISLREAQDALLARTRDRMKQGIEGTSTVGTETERPATVPQSKQAEGNPIMQYFAFGHLPRGPMQDMSRACCGLAVLVDTNVKAGAEKSAGLRKLLEAKDCFVRAVMSK